MPEKGTERMALDSRFTGREEKRLPVTMEIDLVPAEGAEEERRERGVVENISGLGVRVFARIPKALTRRARRSRGRRTGIVLKLLP